MAAKSSTAKSPLGVGSAVVGQATSAAQNVQKQPKQVAASVAGFIVGVLLDVLFINYLKGGWPQVKAWLAAKFLNEPNASYGT
jgi:uncharacterized PurR-regulated membrane protein YhhQ (DUF165 family)